MTEMFMLSTRFTGNNNLEYEIYLEQDAVP